MAGLYELSRFALTPHIIYPTINPVELNVCL